MKITTEEKDRRFQQSVLDQPRARRIQDASRAIGISRTTIYNLAAAGKIRLIKIGGRTLVPESEIDRLVEGV
jgi:excisionase family DNA binding protein